MTPGSDSVSPSPRPALAELFSVGEVQALLKWSPVELCTFSALAGVVGGIVGSPIFLVKTQLQVTCSISNSFVPPLPLQTSSSPGISVGHQHQHGSMARAFTNLYR